MHLTLNTPIDFAFSPRFSNLCLIHSGFDFSTEWHWSDFFQPVFRELDCVYKGCEVKIGNLREWSLAARRRSQDF